MSQRTGRRSTHSPPSQPPTSAEAVVLPSAEAVAAPTPDGRPIGVSGLAIVSLARPADPAVVGRAVFPAGRSKAYRGRTYQFDEDTWSGVLALPDRKTFVIGSEDALVWLIDRLGADPAPGPLAAVRAEAGKHTVFAAVNPAAALPAGAPIPEPFRPLAAATRATVAVDFDKALTITGAIEYPDAAGAAAGREAVSQVIALARTAARGQADELARQSARPVPGGGKLGPVGATQRYALLLGSGLLRRADATLGAVPVSAAGATVRIRPAAFPVPNAATPVTIIAAITALGSNAKGTFQTVGSALNSPPAGPRPEAVRLKALVAALDAYHAEHGHYPPPAIRAKDGTPLLSWRVALLPYLGEKALYARFRLDEPWDSLHNKKLLAELPKAYARPDVWPTNFGKTNTFAIAGPGTLFDGPNGVAKASASAGLGNVLLAVEPSPMAMKPEYWSKPADVPVGPDGVPQLFSKYEWEQCWAVFADGTARELDRKADGPKVPGWVRRAGPGK